MKVGPNHLLYTKCSFAFGVIRNVNRSTEGLPPGGSSPLTCVLVKMEKILAKETVVGLSLRPSMVYGPKLASSHGALAVAKGITQESIPGFHPSSLGSTGLGHPTNPSRWLIWTFLKTTFANYVKIFFKAYQLNYKKNCYSNYDVSDLKEQLASLALY